jgi:kinesin family protein 2/24
MKMDMRNRMMTHHEFNFDRVFDDDATNEQVYNETASKLVDLVLTGSFTTCLMYGQTGSGKTYTMSALYEHAATNLFLKIDQTKYAVSMSFVEIAGDRCNDLLNRFQDAPLLTAQDGLVWPYPIVELDVESAEDLIAFVRFGSGVRSTSATGVHDASSRSHAILRIYVRRKNDTQEKTGRDTRGGSTSTAASRRRWGGNGGHRPSELHHDDVPVEGMEFEGVLSLVDLAGSEKNIDSMHHSAQRRKEGAQINASLMALKDCVRARASGKNRSHVYRKSKLTMALKGSFILPTAKTMIIATVSPSSKDTEHSLNTLRHACIMDLNEGATAKRRGSSNQRGSNNQRGKPRGNNPRGNNPRGKQQRNGMPSGSGSSEHNTGGTSRRNSTVNSWTENIGEINVGREARILKSQKGNGAQLQSNGNDGFQKDQHQQALTGKEIRRQRISAEKRSLALLTVGQKKLLGQGRRSLGANSSTFAQSHRLQRTMSPYPQSALQKEELAARDARRAGLRPSPKQKAHIKRVTKRTASQRSRDGLYTNEDVEELYKQMSNPNLTPANKKRMQLLLAKALAYVAAHGDDEDDEEGAWAEGSREEGGRTTTIAEDYAQQQEEERLRLAGFYITTTKSIWRSVADLMR